MCKYFKESINQLLKDFVAKDKANASGVKGLTNNDILLIEYEMGVNLPAVYKQFLSACGKGGGNLLNNSVINYYPGILYLPEGVQEMITEHSYDPIPCNAFFFANSLGLYYWHFVCDESHDPDVYLIVDENKKHLKFCKLSDFIIQALSRAI